MFGNFNCKKEINLLGLNVWIENRSLQDQISLQIKGSYFVCSILFFSSSWIQYNCQLLTPKLFAPFKHLTWTRPHWEATPAHATSPKLSFLQSQNLSRAGNCGQAENCGRRSAAQAGGLRLEAMFVNTVM